MIIEAKVVSGGLVLLQAGHVVVEHLLLGGLHPGEVGDEVPGQEEPPGEDSLTSDSFVPLNPRLSDVDRLPLVRLHTPSEGPEQGLRISGPPDGVVSGVQFQYDLLDALLASLSHDIDSSGLLDLAINKLAVETGQEVRVEESDLVSSELAFLVNLPVQESFQHSPTLPLPSLPLRLLIGKHSDSEEPNVAFISALREGFVEF